MKELAEAMSAGRVLPGFGVAGAWTRGMFGALESAVRIDTAAHCRTTGSTVLACAGVAHQAGYREGADRRRDAPAGAAHQAEA